MNGVLRLEKDVRSFKTVEEFRYLGAIITENNNTSKEI